ncbi:hypothetical protein WJX74_006185 [Apatococcus lobatus]|uniref:Uncharacterized protein n=1 Tax=Apatococcus lobatus TaxID=904363 RepID=A0AAW1RGF5_9CHLO
MPCTLVTSSGRLRLTARWCGKRGQPILHGHSKGPVHAYKMAEELARMTHPARHHLYLRHASPCGACALQQPRC